MSKEKSTIQPLYSSFVAIGVPQIPKEGAKIPFYSEGKSESGFVWNKINFSVKTSETNSMFVELNGGYFDNGSGTILKSQDKEKKEYNIPWSKRNEKTVMDNVADYKKLSIDLLGSDYNSDTKKIFITEYDVVKYLKENLVTVNTRIVITGNIRFDRYKDKNTGVYKTSTHYVIKNIRLAKDTEENKAECKLQFVYDKDSWDEGTLKDDKKVYINGYTTSYDRDLKQQVFIPVMYLFNFSNFNFVENPAHARLLDLYRSYFKAKNKEYYVTEWAGAVVRGAEVKEITMDDLTDDQKLQIECGLATFEQVQKDMRGSVVGDKVNEVRLHRPTNAYDNSPSLLTEYDENDFIMEFEVPDENLDDVLNQIGDAIGDAIGGGMSKEELDILSMFK